MPTCGISDAVQIPDGSARLNADLHVPAKCQGLVIFAHGSGSSRFSTRNRQVAESLEPGRGSFLIEGTLTNKLMKGAKVSLCGDDCRGTEDKLMERIATEAWGFPKVGYEPKK